MYREPFSAMCIPLREVLREFEHLKNKSTSMNGKAVAITAEHWLYGGIIRHEHSRVRYFITVNTTKIATPAMKRRVYNQKERFLLLVNTSRQLD